MEALNLRSTKLVAGLALHIEIRNEIWIVILGSVGSNDLYIGYLVEICQIGDFVPEVGHDFCVLLVGGVDPVTLALDDGVPDGQALEVVLVEEAVVVDVVHVADDELDTVVPAVSHGAGRKGQKDEDDNYCLERRKSWAKIRVHDWSFSDQT